MTNEEALHRALDLIETAARHPCVAWRGDPARPTGVESAEVVRIIRLPLNRGSGTIRDPYRVVWQYRDLDGKFLAEQDYGVPLDGTGEEEPPYGWESVEAVHPDGWEAAKEIYAIRTVAKRGKGTLWDPLRKVTQYWTLDGNWLATYDPEEGKMGMPPESKRDSDL